MPDEELEAAAEDMAEDAVEDAASRPSALHDDAVEKAVEAEALYAAADELAAEAVVEEVVAEDLASRRCGGGGDRRRGFRGRRKRDPDRRVGCRRRIESRRAPRRAPSASTGAR